VPAAAAWLNRTPPRTKVAGTTSPIATDPQQPADGLAAPAGPLDGGPSATLLLAIGQGGQPLSEDAFEHGLQALINGTTAALTP